MDQVRVTNILIAVSDKSSIDGLLPILGEHDVKIWATAGTANYIKSKGYEATSIVSGFDFDGRVKSLDRTILAQVLADKSNPRHMEELRRLSTFTLSPSIVTLSEAKSLRVNSAKNLKTGDPSPAVQDDTSAEPFDAVVVELYNLDQTNFPESMDIGGMTLIRAAIKNFENVALAFDQSSIEGLTEHLKTNDGSTQLIFRKEEAKKASFFIAQRCNLEAKMFEST